MDCSGTVHRFLESEDPLHFSTRLFDVKCRPMCFTLKNVLKFPQTARVYKHPNSEEEEEEANLLENLSTVTITEETHGHHLVVRKLSEDGLQLGPAFTVPWNADLKVMLHGSITACGMLKELKYVCYIVYFQTTCRWLQLS